jgi:hypothetical protein
VGAVIERTKGTTMAKHIDLPQVLRIDAVLNAGAGLGVLLAAPALTAPLGLATAWPLRIVGALLLVNGVEHWLAARATPPPRTMVTGLARVDFAFAAAVLGIAVSDPTGAEAWMRWALVGLADLTAVFGILKLAALRQYRRVTVPQ